MTAGGRASTADEAMDEEEEEESQQKGRDT
jgi:hypothetical protein